MTITFSMTARELVTRAMRDRKVLAIRQNPTAAELAYGVETINLILKDLAVHGVTPWREEEGAAVFGAGISTVTLSPRPVDVLDANLAVSVTLNRPMRRWEKGEFSTIPNPGQSGTPILYTVTETPAAVNMRVWPVPTVSTTINYTYSRAIEDVNDASDVLDIPQMWLRGFQHMLAADLEAFGDGGDPVHLQRVTLKGEAAKQALLDHDRPAYYTMEPDF